MSAVLWHIKLSHYSEKARWALDWKGIPWEGKAPLPGLHMAYALGLTRGRHKTFPILQLDGRTVADSSAIVAALDQHRADPPLIPAGPAERARALALQEHFDAGLGPAVRLLAFHELRRDHESMARFTEVMAPAALTSTERRRRVATRVSATFAQVRFRVASEEAASAARVTVLDALERIDRDLEANGGGPFLVGERFSVADLTAASLLMPLTQPPEGPNHLEPPPGLREFCEPLLDRPAFRWVLETYARYRLPAA